jgi:hypothetical protein
MNKLKYFLICFITIFQGCDGQTSPKTEIFNEEFNWKITIPENFQNVSVEEWTNLQNKGADAIEKTYDEKIINRANTIFVFKSDELNYFESNSQPFDITIDGDYLESCKNVNNMLYETFKTQLPDIKIDSSTSVEKISKMEFQTFKMKIEYPNKMIMNVIMYSRLFDKKEFTVNIMYVDNKKGEQMLDSWKNSKFTK